MGTSGTAAQRVCHARWHVRAPLAGWLAMAGCAPPAEAPRAVGPMEEGAFVWQRVWTPAVTDAITTSGPNFDRISVLVAEIEADGRVVATDALRPVGLSVLAAMEPVELVVRAAALPVEPEDEAVLVRTLTGALRHAEEHAVRVRAVHLDIDVPTAKLPDYAALVARLGAAVAPLPVEVLALPSWVDAPGQQALAEAADRLVLQVHGLEPQADGPPVLFDADAAVRAVEALGAQGRPFRVALPTHGWPELGVRAEPAAIAPVVARWQHDRPAGLEGLRWFRLPVAGDSHTWTSSTLAAVRAGRVPAAMLQVDIDPGPSEGLFLLTLESTGEDAAKLPTLCLQPAPGGGLVRLVDLRAEMRPEADGDGLILRPAPGQWMQPGTALRWTLLAVPGAGQARADAPGVSMVPTPEGMAAPGAAEDPLSRSAPQVEPGLSSPLDRPCGYPQKALNPYPSRLPPPALPHSPGTPGAHR